MNNKNIIQFPQTKWFEVKNKTDESADIYLYDEISPYLPDSNAKDVITQLQALSGVKLLNVRINSPGGSVFEGMAIYNALLRHPGDVHVWIDGVAASIASVIAMAGKVVHMSDNAMFMIHNPSGVVLGTSEDLRKTADVLDQLKDNIINVYQTRTGASREQLAKQMDDESWFTAEEAVKAKFVDKVVKGAKIAAHFDFSNFKHPPSNLSASAENPSTTPRTLLKRKQALHEKQ